MNLPAGDLALFQVSEVAAMLRVSRMTIYRLVNDGVLGSVRVGRGFRIPRQALEDYLAAHYTQSAA